MGVNTTNGYFYLPDYGASGTDEKALYDAGQQVADTQIEANKNAIEAMSGDDVTNWIIPQTYATGSGTSGDPWAGSCIEDAVSAASAGDTIYLCEGYYLLNGTCTINKHNLTIRGAGINKTIILTATGAYDGFRTDGYDYLTFENFTLDGTGMTSGSYDAIDLNNTEHVTVRNVEVKESAGNGINYYQGNYGTFENLLLHNNAEHGIHPGSQDTARNMYNIYRNLDCYDNTSFGYSDRGTGQSDPLLPLYSTWNIFDGIRAWGNGSNGIQIAYQKSVTISNCTAYNNDAAGFKLTGLQEALIVNCIADSNGASGDTSYEGIIIEGKSSTHSSYLAKNIHLINVISKNHQETSYGGITIRDADYVTLTECQSYDDQDTPTQKYGLRIGALAGTVTNVRLVNCTFYGNVTADIYDSYDEDLVVDGVKNGHEAVAGDILYHNGTDWVMLAKGTADQVLTMNDGATAPNWEDAAGGGGGLDNVVEDTTPELGGEMDCGAHSIGFTLQTVAEGDGTTTFDFKLGNHVKFTFGAQNETFTFTAPSNPCHMTLVLVQDAVGSRTVTWPVTVKWVGGTAPTLTTDANGVDVIGLFWDGTNYFAAASLDFSVPA